MRRLLLLVLLPSSSLIGGPVLADMMTDTPVTFPKRGALPAWFPPDVQVRHPPAEKDYYIFETPERSLDSQV